MSNQPNQPTDLEAMTAARDYWYEQATHRPEPTRTESHKGNPITLGEWTRKYLDEQGCAELRVVVEEKDGQLHAYVHVMNRDCESLNRIIRADELRVPYVRSNDVADPRPYGKGEPYGEW